MGRQAPPGMMRLPCHDGCATAHGSISRSTATSIVKAWHALLRHDKGKNFRN